MAGLNFTIQCSCMFNASSNPNLFQIAAIKEFYEVSAVKSLIIVRMESISKKLRLFDNTPEMSRLCIRKVRIYYLSYILSQ